MRGFVIAALLLGGLLSSKPAKAEEPYAGERITTLQWWSPQAKGKQRVRVARRHIQHLAKARGHRRTNILMAYANVPGSKDLSGFPAPLVEKARELESTCAATIISGFRPGARVAGSGRPSLHSVRRAIDMRGGYSCMYAHLRDWPGGYSIDPGRVHHIHISYEPGGREWGAHFAHYSVHRIRYAHRRRHLALQ